jgi:hypothetical protein
LRGLNILPFDVDYQYNGKEDDYIFITVHGNLEHDKPTYRISYFKLYNKPNYLIDSDYYKLGVRVDFKSFLFLVKHKDGIPLYDIDIINLDTKDLNDIIKVDYKLYYKYNDLLNKYFIKQYKFVIIEPLRLYNISL